MTATLAVSDLELEGPYATLEQLLALRHVPLATLRRAQLRHGSHSGIRQSRHRGRGIDFAEVRLYQPGDDVRSIDWRVTARKARPHTKIFREERERPTLIIVDQSQSMFFGSTRRLKSVLAAEAASLLAWHGLDIGERVGGIVVGNSAEHVFRPYRNTRSVVRLLACVADLNTSLTRATQVEPDRMAAALRHAARVAPRGHRVFLISDLAGYDDNLRRLLLNVGRYNDLTVVLTVDPMDRELPPPDRYAITDGHGRAELDTGNMSLRQRYHERYGERVARIRETCSGAAIRLLVLETGADVAPQIAALEGA